MAWYGYIPGSPDWVALEDGGEQHSNAPSDDSHHEAFDENGKLLLDAEDA